jgi:hypothetical protein
MKGCRWKIGDGTKINIVNEPWLKKDDGRWIQSPQTQGVASLYVHELLCPNEKVWDSNKIHSIFPTCVANSILAVPLFDDVVEDQLVWDDDLHGNYSVKSGYNLLLHTTIEGVSTQEKAEWKCLWKVHAPPKSKHLLWRICKGCLPTRTRLKERHVPCPTTCPLCDSAEEDDWHFLYGCEYSRHAWQAASLHNTVAMHVQQVNSAK